jgi:hypothetical protein
VVFLVYCIGELLFTTGFLLVLFTNKTFTNKNNNSSTACHKSSKTNKNATTKVIS